MANKKISALTAATALTSATFAAEQSGVTKGVPIALFDAAYQGLAANLTALSAYTAGQMTNLDGLSALTAEQLQTVQGLADLAADTGFLKQTADDTFAIVASGVAASTDVPTRADVDARFVHVVDNVADLRLLTTTTFSGDRIWLRGYYDVADYADGLVKGGGWLFHDAASVASDNDATVYVDGSDRRWVRPHGGTITFGQCGAKIDDSADDLLPLNTAIGLLIDNNSGVNVLQIEAGTFHTSDTPTFCYRQNSAIIGAGMGSTKWVQANNAGTFLRFGYDDGLGAVTAATRWRFEGIQLAYEGTCTSTEPAILVAAARDSVFKDIVCQGAINGLLVGLASSDNSEGLDKVDHCYFGNITFNTMSPTDGGICFDIRSATGNVFVGCYAGMGNAVDVADCRCLSMAPTSGSEGCDGNVFIGCAWNYVQAKIDYGFEFDTTYPAVKNFAFVNCTLDGGAIASISFKCSNTATSTNCSIFNGKFANNRISASTSVANGGGGGIRVTQNFSAPMNGIEFTGNNFIVGCNYPFFQHNRTGTATVDMFGLIAAGNTISIMPTTLFADYATTANITLSGVQNIDGGTGAAGQTILVKDQSAAAENGVYVMRADAWTRVSAFDSWEYEVVEGVVGVLNGSTHAATLWQTDATTGGTLGTTAINFATFDPTQTFLDIEANGLVFTGNMITYSSNYVEAVTSFPLWPFFDYMATFGISSGASNIRGVLIEGNYFRQMGQCVLTADVSGLAADGVMEGPIIRNNINCMDPPIRQVTTSGTGATVLAQQSLVNGYTYRIKAVVTAVSNGGQRASYTVAGLFSAAGGTATLEGQNVVEEVEDDSAWTVLAAVNGANARITVEGNTGDDVTWGLSEFRMTAIAYVA